MSGCRWKAAMIGLLAALLAGGCSTQAPRVDCDGRLEPINRLAPQVAAGLVLTEQTEVETAKP